MTLMFLDNCSACECLEERLFTDSWTGLSLCLACLLWVGEYVTNSPQSEEDNLKRLLTDNDLMSDAGCDICGEHDASIPCSLTDPYGVSYLRT